MCYCPVLSFCTCFLWVLRSAARKHIGSYRAITHTYTLWSSPLPFRFIWTLAFGVNQLTVLCDACLCVSICSSRVMQAPTWNAVFALFSCCGLNVRAVFGLFLQAEAIFCASWPVVLCTWSPHFRWSEAAATYRSCYTRYLRSYYCFVLRVGWTHRMQAVCHVCGL